MDCSAACLLLPKEQAGGSEAGGRSDASFKAPALKSTGCMACGERATRTRHKPAVPASPALRTAAACRER